MTNLFRVEDEPGKARLDYWQHVMASTFVPYQIAAVGDGLRGLVRRAEIGPVTVLDVHTSAMEYRRTADLIRDSDYGMCKIGLARRGRGVFEQDGREAVLRPGDFFLMDLSRPNHVAIEGWHQGSIVVFPQALLPVRHNELRQLTAVRFSPRDPYAALVTSLVTELTRHLDAYEYDRDPRIGRAFLDLLSLALATRLDRVAAVPADSRQNAMMLRIQSFIERHLADPRLSPGMIAAAHHVSVRALHKLYEAEEQTISASIRRQRLERSREDLLDPGLRDRPVSAVGARWGFQDPAAFSRAFRAAYGAPPAEYRAMQEGARAARATEAGDPGPGTAAGPATHEPPR